MKFIAWYCYRCNMYWRGLELNKGNCPECRGVVVPEPMKTKEEPELLKAIAQIEQRANE